MSVPKRVPITQYQQRLSTLCAPACAEMVYSSLGVMPADMIDQFALNHVAKVVPGPLALGNPLGLATALEKLAPKPFPAKIGVTPAATPDVASGNIVDALYALGVPVPVLVEECSHWIAVHGVDTNVVPAPGTPYQIDAFWFHDPADEALIPPTGPEHHVPYQDWLNTWLTGCGKFPDPFIIVAGAGPAPAGDLRPMQFEKPDSPHLISPAAATEFALRGLGSYGLERYRLTDQDAYDSEPAQLVQRTDRVDEFFYLVPLRWHSGPYTVVRVDAQLGTYLGAQFGRANFRYVDHEQLTERLDGVAIEADDFSALLRPGTYDVHPTLVWRPSIESPSPYHPVYQVNVGDKTVYSDPEARVYPGLTVL